MATNRRATAPGCEGSENPQLLAGRPQPTGHAAARGQIEIEMQNGGIKDEWILADSKLTADEFCCSICMDVAGSISSCGTEIPVYCNPCQHIFCRKCITKWMECGGSSCPKCKHEISIVESLRISPFAMRAYSKIRISCPMKCGWKGGVNQCSNHLPRCPMVLPTKSSDKRWGSEQDQKGTSLNSDNNCPSDRVNSEEEEERAFHESLSLEPVRSCIVATKTGNEKRCPEQQQKYRSLSSDDNSLSDDVDSEEEEEKAFYDSLFSEPVQPENAILLDDISSAMFKRSMRSRNLYAGRKRGSYPLREQECHAWNEDVEFHHGMRKRTKTGFRSRI
mmetsp:Transcript_28361/g.52964  ORF Transcript_28361/g.52964 Transcript_28361/m.52964 type:complete len:334 (-) Transcript_28361:525-1526(-)